MHTAAQLQEKLVSLSTPERAAASTWFFKSGPGEYGEGDKFYGVSVPTTRAVVKECTPLPLGEIKKLLDSEWHEARLAACLVLVRMYGQADATEQSKMRDFYLSNTQRINNWDLVDSSAEHIVGPTATLKLLKELCQSELIWDRRIAVLATFYSIKRGDPGPTLYVAGLLLQDTHDLIHKAVGWMLREVGKRIDEGVEQTWLLENGRYKSMPRTMLRYAIERFPADLRNRYLKGEL